MRGGGQWHAPDPEGHVTYLDFRLDDIAYNVVPERLACVAPEGPSMKTALIAGNPRH